MDLSVHLSKNEGEPVSQVEYARVGSLMYMMNYSRLDIACSINKLSIFTSNPSKDHWMTLERVLRYLRYTLNYELHYTRYLAVLEGYSDVN